MSVFRNIRIYPDHGARSATITWELADGVDHGDVYVAFSLAGTDGSWEALNPTAPVPSEGGMYVDDTLIMNSASVDGFYRLLLTTDGGLDYFSEPIRIMGDLTPQEYGILRAAIHQEYTQMRVTNGFPIWYCIPRAHGEPADNIDPDTGKAEGEECDVLDPEENSYGMAFQGGFYPPVLTWMKVLKHNEALQDDNEVFNTEEINKMAVRLMAFPRPMRNHMIVNPATDERWLVSNEIKPMRLRGIAAVAYLVTLDKLSPRDERYKFPVPFVDTKQYRRIPYWTPETLETA